jgi:hypothetical protein
MPLEALILKLRNNTNLDNDDIGAIKALPMNVKKLPARTSMVSEGDRPAHCCLMIDGFAIRSKTTDEGRRQILSIHIRAIFLTFRRFT